MDKINSKTKFGKAASQAGQIASIAVFFVMFFLFARISVLYGSVWQGSFKSMVNVGLIISAVIFGACAGVVVHAVKKGYMALIDYRDAAACGLMIVVHYLIRVQIVGTLQLDEGLTCYESLEHLVYHPDMILSNFIEAGKIADRSAYGYCLFALMGEFLIPGNGTGFQWSQLYMGIAAACCIYMTFRRLFPKARLVIVWFGALVVSFSPMALGMSTLCGLEYGMTMFFIYAFYCCVSKKYTLMVFWLIMLGTTKSSGMLVALCFAGAFLVGIFTSGIRKRKNADTTAGGASASGNDDADGDEYNVKTGIIAIAAIVAVVLFLYGVIRVCAANGIAFSGYYIKIKLAQLFVLNFNWIWLIIVIAGIVMVSANLRVRRTHRMDFTAWLVLVGSYMVYVLYLLAYPKATLPRYNMLADTIFAMFGVIMLIKLFERRRVILSTFTVLGALMLVETFITVDPVSAALFTNMQTNRFPILYTAGFHDEQEDMNGNPGDYAYYNYHYTFVNNAIDSILEEYDAQTDIIVASSANDVETQFRQDNIRWNPDAGQLVYYSEDTSVDCYSVNRVAVDGILKLSVLPEKLVYIEIPWNHGDSKNAIEMLDNYYYVDGPKVMYEGQQGTVLYYFFTLKQTQE